MAEDPGICDDPKEPTEGEIRERECMFPIHNGRQPSATPLMLAGVDSIRCD